METLLVGVSHTPWRTTLRLPFYPQYFPFIVLLQLPYYSPYSLKTSFPSHGPLSNTHTHSHINIQSVGSLKNILNHKKHYYSNCGDVYAMHMAIY